jgi:hypothetical protein
MIKKLKVFFVVIIFQGLAFKGRISKVGGFIHGEKVVCYKLFVIEPKQRVMKVK